MNNDEVRMDLNEPNQKSYLYQIISQNKDLWENKLEIKFTLKKKSFEMHYLIKKLGWLKIIKIMSFQ